MSDDYQEVRFIDSSEELVEIRRSEAMKICSV